MSAATSTAWVLSPDRCFAPNPARRDLARSLHALVAKAPIVSPHGHVDPRLLADPDATLGTPVELLVIPDHYVLRMLYSQGVALEDLGVTPLHGRPAEADHRRIWQRFAERFHLFRGTPSGYWLADELVEVFGVEERLTGESAQRVYDHLEERLARPEFSPRALAERFRVETLCTTDGAADPLAHHLSLREEGREGWMCPTFRPDAVVNLDTPGWDGHLQRLAQAAGTDIADYGSFVRALEDRRAFFKATGALATDHSAVTPYAERLTEAEAAALFARALKGAADAADAARFTAHMLVEMARMSVEDGLVMQIHAGSARNHNPGLFERFGPDRGADIPVRTEWTRNLQPLLGEYGDDPRLRLVLYTLDESAYSRELAPLAGHYPAVYLGAPWWFYDSPEGMRRYLDAVIETAGFHNLAGFNDDTRAFASIPARHDMWRRVTCDWLAGRVVRGLIDEDDAPALAEELAGGLARRAYRLEAT
jgi:glucuronate isomerase